MTTLTRNTARTISIIEFTHTDGSTQGGVVSAQREFFSVVSHPRYGDVKGRRFAYEDVAEYRVLSYREPVHLPVFGDLMSGVLTDRTIGE